MSKNFTHSESHTRRVTCGDLLITLQLIRPLSEYIISLEVVREVGWRGGDREAERVGGTRCELPHSN